MLFLVGVTVACPALLLLALRAVPLLRVPVLDLDLIAGRARIMRPQILAPARILDPASDVKVAADALVEWARGEVLDLWKPESWNGLGAPTAVARTIPAQPKPLSGLPNFNRKRATPQSYPTLANGTELIAVGRLSGAGELRFVNNTDLEEIAILLRRKTTLRAIYIRPKSEAILRSIDTGLYDVNLELGTGLDVRRLRFHQDGYSPDPVGPFEFFSVTSATGTSGQHYEVIVTRAECGKIAPIER